MDAALIIAQLALPSGAPPSAISALLVPGAEFDGLIATRAEGLALHVRGQRIPLEGGSGLREGQRVHVTVREIGGQFRLEIQPQTAPARSAPPSAPFRLLEQALAIAGRSISQLGGDAPALLPGGLPARLDAVQLALGLFTARADVAGALRELATLLGPAIQAGHVTAMPAAALLRLLESFRGDRARDWQTLLRESAALRNATPEAALRSGAEPIPGLRAWLDSLESNAILRAALRESGSEERVLELAGGLRDRITGLQLQQGRDTPLPYTLIEVPLPGGGPREGVQLHLFGGRPSDARRAMPVRFALDVELSATGALWIQGEVTGDTCRCRLRVAHEHVYDAIQEERPALEEALAGLDYSAVQVSVDRWEGDRTRAAAEFLATIDGFNLTA